MLTPKQTRFVEEFLLDLNATRAAIRAGYSTRNADKIGSQLLQKTTVKAAIDAAKDARSERTQIDALWVLQRLVEECEADLADLYDDNGNLRPIEEWPVPWRRGLVQGVETEELFEGQGKDRVHIGRVRKIRLDSRIKRIEMIGRHVRVNAFQENVHHTGLDELGNRLQRALARCSDQIIDGTSERVEPKAIPAPREPLPRPDPAPSAPDPAPPPAPAGADWAYSPIMPEKQAFADVDYENSPDGLLSSYRNTGDYDGGC